MELWKGGKLEAANTELWNYGIWKYGHMELWNGETTKIIEHRAYNITNMDI